MANMDLEDVVILGNGPRYKKLSDDVRIWVKKTNNTNFSYLIEEMKRCFFDKPNLEYVGVDNFDSIQICPKMCILVSRQNIITTFQNPNDLDYFILNKLGVNYS